MLCRLVRGIGSFSSKQTNLIVQKNLAIVELNNPSKRNALSKQLLVEFNEIISELSQSQNINCVILRSSTLGMFCAGADLKERIGLTNQQVSELVLGLRTTFQKWYNLPMPTLASIDGAALGGGLELALACDIRVATSTSKIGLPETSLAIIPGAGGTQRLPRTIGLAKAKELIFTSSRLNAQEALEMGLINYVEKDFEASNQKCEEIASKILENGPIGVRCAKMAINRGSETDLETGLAIEGFLYHHVVVSSDRIEGLQAFNEKRKPQYKGQ